LKVGAKVGLKLGLTGFDEGLKEGFLVGLRDGLVVVAGFKVGFLDGAGAPLTKLNKKLRIKNITKVFILNILFYYKITRIRLLLLEEICWIILLVVTKSAFLR
jgi:hypothetical protein